MCGRYLLKSAESELRPIFGFIEHPNLAPQIGRAHV